MASVPIYEPQVREKALPAFREESVGGPALFGADGGAETAVGNGMLAAGTGLAAIEYQMAERANLQAVQDANVAYGSQLLDFQTEARKKRTGHGAAGLTKDFNDWHEKTVKSIAESLGNDMQRATFIQTAKKSGLAGRHDIASFELGETQKAQTTSFTAVVANDTALGAVAATPEVAEAAKTRVMQNTLAFAATRNMNKDETDALLSQNLTEFHLQRIQSIVRLAPNDAKLYFDQNQHEIDGKKRAEIGEFATQATATSNGIVAADKVWATMGPKSDTDPIQIDKMLAAVRDQYKNDPHTLKAATSAVQEQYNATMQGRTQRSNGLQADVNQAIMQGVPMSRIRQMPSFLSLPADKQLSVVEHAESISAARASRAEAYENRAERALLRANIDTVLKLQDPNVLTTMTREEVINLRPRIGTAATQDLLGRWDQYSKNSTLLSEAKIDNEQFNDFASRLGLNPKGVGLSSEQKDTIVRVRNQVETIIGQEQMARKKPLTREEKDVIMQRELDKSVMVSKDWWFDKSKPQITLSPAEQAKAYVMVEGKEVRLATIPAGDRQAITAALKKANIPVSEQKIAEYYVAGQRAKAQVERIPQ